MSRSVDGMIVVRTRSDDARIALMLENRVSFRFALDAPPTTQTFLGGYGWHGLAYVQPWTICYRWDIAISGICWPAELMFSVLVLASLCSGDGRKQPRNQSEWIFHGDLSQGRRANSSNQLLDLSDRPSASWLANDLMAMGAMTAVQQRNLVVGQDLSIIGFDDIGPAEHPPRSPQSANRFTTSQPKLRPCLFNCSKTRPCQQPQQLLTPELVLRGSGACASNTRI